MNLGVKEASQRRLNQKSFVAVWGDKEEREMEHGRQAGRQQATRDGEHTRRREDSREEAAETEKRRGIWAIFCQNEPGIAKRAVLFLGRT